MLQLNCVHFHYLKLYFLLNYHIFSIIKYCLNSVDVICAMFEVKCQTVHEYFNPKTLIQIKLQIKLSFHNNCFNADLRDSLEVYVLIFHNFMINLF